MKNQKEGREFMFEGDLRSSNPVNLGTTTRDQRSEFHMKTYKIASENSKEESKNETSLCPLKFSQEGKIKR